MECLLNLLEVSNLLIFVEIIYLEVIMKIFRYFVNIVLRVGNLCFIKDCGGGI